MSVTSRVIRNARKRGVNVRTRKQWGAGFRNMAVYQWRRVNRHHSLLPKTPVDTVVQHITVTNRSGNLDVDMRNLHDIGVSRFGSGVSYNWCVDMVTGTVGLGQSLDAAGTHTVNDKNVPGFSKNQNYVAIAIAVIGMPDDELSPVAKLSISRLIAAHIDEGAVREGFDYKPHSFFAAKDCPCDSTRNSMNDMRKGSIKLVHTYSGAFTSWRGLWRKRFRK